MSAEMPPLSEAKRLLLRAYLRGERPPRGPARDPLPCAPRDRPAPLSFGQHQLWLLAQLQPAVPAYNESITVEMPGPLDAVALDRAFDAFLRRHEAWRTVFPLVDGQPVQEVRPPSTWTVPLVDLRHLPVAAREAEALRLATAQARDPFDLQRGPLLRTTLVWLDEARHKLFVTLHHIIFDGFSLHNVFLPELAALYTAYASGTPATFPDLPIQYRDYAAWQRQAGGAQEWAADLAFWCARLGDAGPPLHLPTDRPRPPVPTGQGAVQWMALPQSLRDGLHALSRNEGVTLFMTLVAAFQTLLYRHTGQDDILLGTVSGARTRVELEHLLGYVLNTIVLRTDLSGNPTFRALLQRVREVTLDAYAHDGVPFERVVQELQPRREPGQAPWFNAMLTLDPAPPALSTEWELRKVDVDSGATKFDLSLELDDRPDGLIGRLTYSTDLFSAATMTRLLGHLRMVLESVVADPERPLGELPLLTALERRQALVEWQGPRTGYPADQCIHELVAARAVRAPGATAVAWHDQRLTYGELNSRANRVAHYLRAAGVGPEVRVGLLVERSPDMIVGLLGILKAGAAYVPLDPADPPARCIMMLKDTGAPLLLTQERFRPELAAGGVADATGVTLVCLDADAEAIARQSAEEPASRATAESLAYVMYTSGSTGQPKGIAVPHCAVTRLVVATDYIQLGPADRIAQAAHASFDAATFEIWGALLNGAQLIIVDKDTLLSPQRCAAALREHRISVLFVTTALFNRLADAVPWAFEPLECVLFGGEAADPARVQAVLASRPPRRLLHVYGPTENTTFSSWYRVQDVPADATTIPIGRAIANSTMYVLDHHRQPVPVGVPGEVYLGGAGVARGYLNRPDLTAERFIADPYSGAAGACLYRSGDIARYRPDGNVEFLGRADNQVKLRGFRIELGEIEAVLGQHPGVREAVVLAVDDGQGSKRLVAYLAVTAQPAPSLHDIRAFLHSRLPDYMIPAAFVPLPALPLTPSGKVDRQALLAIDPGAQEQGRVQSVIPPRNPLHHQLIRIWEELLDVRPIGIRDSFFELGGHSLLAVRLLERIEHECGRRLPLSALFAAPTIERLGWALRQQQRRAAEPLLLEVQRGAGRPLFFAHGDLFGGGLYCVKLARHLGTDQPFYALQPHGLDGRPAVRRVEAMATDYLAAIRGVQPRGPYLLGGYCNGGVVAFELARQLEAQGETVSMLALVDAVVPLGSAVGRRVRSIAPAYDGRGGTTSALAEEWRRVTWLYQRAMAAYVPQAYGGRVILLWSEDDGILPGGDPYRGWQRVAADVQVHVVPGAHLTCITTQVHALAARLAEGLRLTHEGG